MTTVKDTLAKQIERCERIMQNKNLPLNSKLGYLLSHARKEWSNGNYIQTVKDILAFDNAIFYSAKEG